MPASLNTWQRKQYKLQSKLQYYSCNYSCSFFKNSHIPKIASSVHYGNIDDAVILVRRTGRGCALAKTDIRNVFCLIPVGPSDYNLLGICWRNKLYVDRDLAMGLSSSCKIFESFSSPLEWVARTKLQIPGILHPLDDFLIVSKPH